MRTEMFLSKKLDKLLILEYNDEVLFDGLKTDSDIVGIKFDGDVIKELKNIKWRCL